MVAKGEALPSILDGICRLVEEISSRSLCSILLLDANGDRNWHGAAPSLPASYTSVFDGRAIGPETGPCGRATYFRKPVIVCDIAADPLGGTTIENWPWRMGCKRAGPHPFFLPKAKCWGVSPCSLANHGVRLRNMRGLSLKLRIWRRLRLSASVQNRNC